MKEDNTDEKECKVKHNLCHKEPKTYVNGNQP